MRELIYRDDCDLFAASASAEEMIRDLMSEYGLTWETNVDDNNFDEDKIYDFARELLQKAQHYIDTAPTITTDEVIAYKCPECKTVSILYNEDKYCPICGIRRKYGNT